jgi:type I restriction enzyme R subunit
MLKERQLEESLIKQLKVLIYIFRPDIVDRRTLEQNFNTKFEALNRVRLSDNEFL